MPLAITIAQTPEDYAAFGDLCRSYLAWCRERYSAMPWFVDEVFGHQALEPELKALATAYGPPQGKTLLATRDGAIVGGGAYRRMSEGICEMKRLFVASSAQGHGLGRRLCESLMAAARAEGYSRMRLDTAHLLTEAIAMYGKLGFVTCPPFHAYPEKLMPYLVFMERPL